MKKRAIVDISTGCLDYYDQPNDVIVYRLKVIVNNEEYTDGETMMADDFFRIISKNSDILPKTSQASVGEVIELFIKLFKEGYEEVLVTTISSALSGTYNSFSLAAKELEDKMDIRIFDTKTVCFPEGLFALRAEEMTKSGASLDEIILELEDMRRRNTIFFGVSRLEFLVKNGRLSGAAAFFGKLLQIKPILQVQETGEIVSIEKIRTLKKCLSAISGKIAAYTNGRPFDAYILYAGNPELKDFFVQTIKEDLGLENLPEVPTTPVIGSHIGPDVVGISIFLRKEN